MVGKTFILGESPFYSYGLRCIKGKEQVTKPWMYGESFCSDSPAKKDGNQSSSTRRQLLQVVAGCRLILAECHPLPPMGGAAQTNTKHGQVCRAWQGVLFKSGLLQL